MYIKVFLQVYFFASVEIIQGAFHVNCQTVKYFFCAGKARTIILTFADKECFPKIVRGIWRKGFQRNLVIFVFFVVRSLNGGIFTRNWTR